MNWSDVYLFCFAVGALWSVASLALGSLHIGHFHSHGHVGHGHLGHGSAGHAHAGVKAMAKDGGFTWTGLLVNPSCLAVFLAWFGGVGYLLVRHSGLAFWMNAAFAIAAGLAGSATLLFFLRFLQSREKPLDPADYEMVGVFGRITSTIRQRGVGELIYVRDGARKMAPACAEEGTEIQRGEEVIVTRYEKGLAYVRTWDAMTQQAPATARLESLQKEIDNVE